MSNSSFGFVIIGRNEGERLRRCFESLPDGAKHIVYVDSGSTDSSVVLATSIGAQIVQLDMRLPFSAGRARNEGFATLLSLDSKIEYVQFIDGDCELSDGWIDYAVNSLNTNPQWAAVSGRLKEKFPQSSIYNALCDIEWFTPIGQIQSCGGIFLIRKIAFQEANGFNPAIIAGEEPELCYRLRQMGWTIHGIDHCMAYHDAAIFKFSQWWKRAVRSGHAYAQGLSMHGLGNEKYCLIDTMRIWFWAFFLPVFILSLGLCSNPMWLFLFFIYFLNIFKIAYRMNIRLADWKKSFNYAFFNIVGKWAQLHGQILFLIKKIQKKDFLIIEYK